MSEKRLTRSTTTSAALTPATNLINNELVEKKRNSTKRKLINGEKQLDGGGDGGFTVKTASLVDDEASSGEAVKQLITATRLNLKQQQSSTNPVRTSSRLSKSNVHNNSYTVLFNNSETSSSSIASSSNMSFDQSTHESLCMPAVTVDVPRKAAGAKLDEFDADESTTMTNVRAKKLAVKTALTENANHNHNHVNSANDSVVQGRSETNTSTTNTDTMPIRNRSSFRLGSINNNNSNNNSHPVESEKISTRRRSSNYLKTNGALTSSLSSVAGNFLDQSFPSRSTCFFFYLHLLILLSDVFISKHNQRHTSF